MIGRRACWLALSAMTLVGGVALAQSWTSVPGARRLARPGAAEVTLELRHEGGGGCGGGGCNVGVAIRNVRGSLPSRALSHYYSDRPGLAPGCFGPARDAALFSDWTEVVIAPARGGEDDRPSCGVAVLVGDRMQYWVVLRLRPVPRAP